jgi:hypothetical protein
MDSDIMDDSVFDDVENNSDAFSPEPVSQILASEHPQLKADLYQLSLTNSPFGGG